MKEQEIIDSIKMVMGFYECSAEHLGRRTSYLPETIRNWLSGKTHMSVNGLQEICEALERKPMIRDANGVYHEDFLEVLDTISKEHQTEVYALFLSEKHAKQNLKKWISGEHGIRLHYLIPILDIGGAEIVIFHKES